jgi:hypothetical protein
MTFLQRFLVAVCLLSTKEMAFSSHLRRAMCQNDNDNDLVSLDSTLFVAVDDIATDAIADAKAHYESLREDFIKEGCLDTCGEFPSSPNTVRPLIEAMEIHGSTVCACGLIYDLAASKMTLLSEVEDEQEEAQLFAQGAASIEASQEEPKLTRMDSWVMVRIPNSKTKCSEDGSASGYPCKNVDLIAHLPLSSFQTTITQKAPNAGERRLRMDAQQQWPGVCHLGSLRLMLMVLLYSWDTFPARKTL